MQQETLRKSQELRRDQFKRHGVSNDDKMTFFLVKWIFNAIKRDSMTEDPKLQGNPYVNKMELVKQLMKNPELTKALGYQNPDEIKDGVRKAGCKKENCLLWEEFLDFFFLKGATTIAERIEGETWWRMIGVDDELPDVEEKENIVDNATQAKKAEIPRYRGANKKLKEVPMTASLHMLQETRVHQTEKEVEEEYRLLADQKGKEVKGSQRPKVDDSALEELGFKRESSKCLLLESQIRIMEGIFEHLDTYKDRLLRRSEFIMALRTDERVVDYIDVNAVQLPNSTRKLTLDEILVEVEKDEMFEKVQMGKKGKQINHKEFITWREFMSYFTDYREIEERNQRSKDLEKTREAI